MEAEYGLYFLRNYQLAPLPGTPALLLFVSPLGGRDTRQEQDETAPEPEIVVSVSSAKPVVERPTSRLNSSQSFGLAKPPPPKFAVGAAEESEVVVIDTLREPVAKAAQAAPEEDLVATGTLSDDEELLLGDGAGDTKKQKLGDGVDSDSDPEKSGPAVSAAAPVAPVAPAAYTEVQPEALVERTEVSPPTPIGRPALQSSPPPGGEAPLPVMPVAVGVAALSQAPCRTGQTSNVEDGLILPVPQERQLRDMDQQVEELLDRFFENSEAWALIQQVIGSAQMQEPGIGLQYFRIQVPSPYPGVQFRKSMHLDDRYSRYAKQGQTVEGVVEGGGEWLRISDKIFLPMKVGPVGIMQPISKEEREEAVRLEKERRNGGEASPVGFSDLPTTSEAAGPAEPEVDQNVLRPNSLRGLPESICKAPLRDPQALNEFYSQNPINALGDTPRRALHPWGSQEPSN